MIAATLLKNANQTIKVLKKFNHLVLKSDANSTLVNRINLKELEKKLVYKCHGPQRDIDGLHKYIKTKISASSSIKNITAEGLIDSFNVTKFIDELVIKDGDHAIIGKKI